MDTSKPRLPSPVSAHQLSFAEDVPLHGVQNLFICGTRSEAEFCIEGVDLEEVAVSAARRARSHVPDAAGSIHSLRRPAGQYLLVGHVLR